MFRFFNPKKVLLFLFLFLFVLGTQCGFTKNLKVCNNKNYEIYAENCTTPINGFAIKIYRDNSYRHSNHKFSNKIEIGNFRNGDLEGIGIFRNPNNQVQFGFYEGNEFIGGVLFGDKVLFGEWKGGGEPKKTNSERAYKKAFEAYEICKDKIPLDFKYIPKLRKHFLDPTFRVMQISYENDFLYDVLGIIEKQARKLRQNRETISQGEAEIIQLKTNIKSHEQSNHEMTEQYKKEVQKNSELRRKSKGSFKWYWCLLACVFVFFVGIVIGEDSKPKSDEMQIDERGRIIRG